MPRSPFHPAQPEGGFAEAPAGFRHEEPAAGVADNSSSTTNAAGGTPAPAPATLALDALMRSDAMRQLLSCDPAGAALFAVDRDVFERRWHNYLVARAAMRDPGTVDDDEMVNRCDAALEMAELLVLATPCAHAWQVWNKLAILEEAVTEDFREGERAAPRVLMALASVKNDLCRFEIVDDRRIHPTGV